jgi:glyoxylase-like metal-dependent hydrolase (beta-lactamase superfamily II)
MIRAATPEQAVQQLRELLPTFDIARDVAGLRTLIVNLFFVGEPGSSEWALVDTGLPMSAQVIRAAAKQRFGDASPQSIILTHGHFDHVGAVRELAELWNVPVYAHELELPYLTGRSAYPPPDPTVGGGMMARLSFLYPRGPIDLRGRIQPLPADSSVPGMEGWQWIHTPGHAPGHVSLWRESDRCLIAGDAFVTTTQEAATSALSQEPVEVHGPPKYFTQDWPAAWASVQRLANLEPEIAVTGHGLPMSGPRLRDELRNLSTHFDWLAVPPRGRYVPTPATFDANGVVSVPPPIPDPVFYATLGAVALGSAAAAGALLGRKQS